MGWDGREGRRGGEGGTRGEGRNGGGREGEGSGKGRDVEGPGKWSAPGPAMALGGPALNNLEIWVRGRSRLLKMALDQHTTSY